MPFTSFKVTGDSLRTKSSAYYALDTGILRNLSTINLNEDAEHMDNYMRIGLAKGDTNVNEIVAVLANGYCDGMTNLNWSGKIPLESDMLLFVELWSSDSSTINIGLVTEL